jgi:hypothetical protein
VTPEQTAKLVSSSNLAWIHLNRLQTENQRPIEFHDHRFMIDPMSDDCDDIVGKKSAQVGWSVMEIMRSIHEAKYLRRNVGYILPTRNVVDDFVKPKVNPLINSNAAVRAMVQDDSISLKKVGDRFIYFKGAFSETSAISFSIDTLTLDEYDRMPDQAVVNIFDSRLQASTHPKRRRFSNPSSNGFGVDSLYTDSDQRHWFVKCHHCNHDWYIDWERDDNHCHYVDRDQEIYACGRCGKELSDDDRRFGRWVAKFPGRLRHGYWFSQMMAPWVSAKRIIQQFNDSTIEFFYNFVLGKSYTASNMDVSREAILRACAPSTIQKLGVVIGVDQNVNEQIWCAGTLQGMFAHGRTKSWEELELLKLQWNATVVCDPNPYPTMPKAMAEKHNDWYLCYFKQQEGLSFVTFKGQIVYADRTRLLDTVANEITAAKLLFREHPYALEDYIADWKNIYRTTVEKENGAIKSEWIKVENKNSDFSFATAYMRIGLSQQLGGGSLLVGPNDDYQGTVTYQEAGRGTLGSAVEDTIVRNGWM